MRTSAMIPHCGAADVGVVAEDLDRMKGLLRRLARVGSVADPTAASGLMSELRFGVNVVRQMHAGDAPAQTTFALDASTGPRYLRLDIDDFDETVAACRDAGVEFWHEVEPIRAPVHRDGQGP